MKQALSPQELAFRKWHVENNQKFMGYVSERCHEAHRKLKLEAEKEGKKIEHMLDIGTMVLMEYASSDDQFEFVVEHYVMTLVQTMEDQEERQKCIDDLWRVIFSINKARYIWAFSKEDALYVNNMAEVIYYLFRYIWEDYEQYVRDNNLELY